MDMMSVSGRSCAYVYAYVYGICMTEYRALCATPVPYLGTPPPNLGVGNSKNEGLEGLWDEGMGGKYLQ